MDVNDMMKLLLQNQKTIDKQQNIALLQKLVQEKKAKENKVLTNQNKTKLSKNSFYQNSQYDFERLNIKTLIIDVDIGTGTTFTKSLIEPFKIDRLSDVYLDSFTVYTAKINNSSTGGNMCFILGLNDFNIQSASNNSDIQNKIIIPNETIDTDKVNIYRPKRNNFICSVNPCTITNIEGSITNSAHPPTTAFASNGRFILELLIIARD